VISIQHPASSIQYPVSSIQYPASSIQHPVSSIQYPASRNQYPMNKNFIVTIIVVSVMFTGCKPSRDKSALDIQNFEKNLYSQQTFVFNKPKGDSLLKMYDDFITRFPADSLSPVFLFKAANLAITEGDGNKALSLLDQFIRKYPDHPKVPVCSFFKGYVYENILKNLDLAKENYLLYIEKYPNDDFVKDARIAIKNLGKTPEQMIKEFEAMQKLDSVRKADSLANLKLKKIRS
jgi:outer membrane protein assembly factor BamD (BamD/ComL family)